MSTSRTREKADGELFKSTGIDDNATSTKVTVSNTGIDVTGRATTDGITSSGTIIFDNGNSSVGIHSDSSDGSYIAYGANEYLRFLYDAGGGETMRMHDSGYVTMPQGVTLGNGNTYAAANTLDDYEEGTWTPVLTGGKTGSGTYVKIGSLVTVNFLFANIGGSGSTAQRVTALPFTSYTQNGGSYSEIYRVEFPSNAVDFILFTYAGSTTLGMTFQVSDGVPIAITGNHLDHSSATLNGTITYRTS